MAASHFKISRYILRTHLINLGTVRHALATSLKRHCVHGNNKENIWAPHYWPFWVKSASYRWFRSQRSSNAGSFSMPWLQVAEIFDDVDDMSSYVSKLLGNIIDSHAPLKCKNIKCNSVPFMNSQLRKAMYKRNMARNKFRKNGCKYWEEHRRQRNKTVAIRKKSIANYFAKNCTRKDKRFWSTVSPFMTDTKCKNSSNISLQNDGKIVVCEKEISEIFNDHLCNVANGIGFDDNITSTSDAISKHGTHPSVLKIREVYGKDVPSFHCKYVDEELISNKLRNINLNKSAGYDNILGKLLRLAHSALAPALTQLVNSCIKSSKFPMNMKLAELSPVYKNDDNLMKENYRPISVLTILSKLQESVVNEQLHVYFVDIFEKLCAFRKQIWLPIGFNQNDWRLEAGNWWEWNCGRSIHGPI